MAVAGFIFVASSFAWPRMMSSRGVLTGAATTVIVFGALAGVTFIDGWARWNFEGYENKAPWPEYEALMVELDKLPDGRVQWEGNGGLNKYGTPMSPMLIPYWTEGSHESMEGLFFESSLTTPFHFINSSEMSFDASNPIPGLTYHDLQMDRGIKHLDHFGVSYYVSFTAEAAEEADGMVEITAISTPTPACSEEPECFRIFKMPETQLVVAATHLPAVYDVPERSLLGSLTGSAKAVGSDGEELPSFHDMALEWYEDVDNIHRWVVADGPDEWPRIESIDERPNEALDVPADPVSNIVLEDHRISFTTTAVGVPHLVKVSYFPNWTAEGADGPWRASPSLMVVVPTSNDVVIEFQDTWAESGGWVLSLVGVGALIFVGVRIWRRKRQPAEPELS